MKKVILRRLKSSQTQGTLGIISINGNEIVQTLELPWRRNLPSVSCIPSGKYLCEKVVSPSKGLCYQVLGVPNREHILFHSGNYLKDSLGCILLGSTSGEENSQFVIYNSRNAFKRFMELLEGDDNFELEVI